MELDKSRCMKKWNRIEKTIESKSMHLPQVNFYIMCKVHIMWKMQTLNKWCWENDIDMQENEISLFSTYTKIKVFQISIRCEITNILEENKMKGNGLSNYLSCPQPRLVIQLPSNIAGKYWMITQVLESATHVGGLDGVPGSWFQPAPCFQFSFQIHKCYKGKP